jgi:hypothetical protein
MSRRDDDLAYGDYHGQGEGQEGDRGFVGDMGRRFFGGKKEVGALPPTMLSLVHRVHDAQFHGCKRRYGA